MKGVKLEISFSNINLNKELLSKKQEEDVIPYFEDYDDRKMWMSYWYQIREVLQTKPVKVLIVGVGNKTVSNYLKTVAENSTESIKKVETVDIDQNLSPDYVCNILELSKNFEDNEYDTILCAEVLEHLPFEEFKSSLKELKKISRKYVILSIPYSSKDFRFSIELPNGKRKDITLKLVEKKEHKFDGWHHWEVGKKGYSKKKIKKIIKNYFDIEKEFIPVENQYHLFFKLKK